ncbi:MAG: DUF2232 domain-containing protein [Bradyrhizobium sp.]|nr:DUF2232 domain-containing protein [Bradyrhizobium sp.]MDE2376289.1 DUF2232 domain-containing protein [Bradyrhizobium sp.]
MMALVLIALVAGAASALMFASIPSGVLISVFLKFLVPMPLMVAALAWGPSAALAGGLFAMLGLGLLADMTTAATFGIQVALPAWWLGHLALLGRPSPASASTSPGELEWYPVGRILVWAAALASLIAIAVLFNQGTDAEAIVEMQRQKMAHLAQLFVGSSVSPNDPAISALVAVVPVFVAMSSATLLIINLWIAAKVTATSGRLRRPWPELRRTELPPMTMAALCLAIAFCFSGGMVALIAKSVTGALMMTYAMMGFAVVHTVTLALKQRLFVLCTTYVLVVLLTWAVLAMVVLGLADAVFGFRERFLRSRPPPLPTP